MRKLILLFVLLIAIMSNPVAYASEGYGSLDDVEATGLDMSILDEISDDDIEMKATYLAIIEHESGFDEGATHQNSNGTYDYGLGQINDITFSFLNDEIGISSMQDLLDGDTNLYAMEALLNYHLDATDDLEDAILRYQVGNGSYARLQRQGVQTTKTHQKVLSLQEKYIELLSIA